jgi:hypothetical protein
VRAGGGGLRDARVRLQLHAEGRGFQLEAQRWGSGLDESDVPAAFFAPLDDDDEAAAQLRGSGEWACTPSGFSIVLRELRELGPARAQLPLREAEVRAAAGAALQHELHATVDGSGLATVSVGSAHAIRCIMFERSWRPSGRDS